MKKFVCSNGRLVSICVASVVSFGLVACGGSSAGGTTPTTSTPITVVCPNGTNQTAETFDVANLACPAPVLLAVVPVNGDITISPDTLTEIIVVTDSVLDPSSITTATVTLKVGSNTTVAGTVVYMTSLVPGCTSNSGFSSTTGVSCASDPKVFKFVPDSKLQYGQTYTFMAKINDTLGKPLVVSSTFTTAPVTCTLPAVWNGVMCAAPTTTIDPIVPNLTNNGNTVVISGLAINTTSFSLIIVAPNGDKWSSGIMAITDVNGNWSLNVSTVFATWGRGNYTVVVYDNNTQLATASFYLPDTAVIHPAFSCTPPQVWYLTACMTPTTPAI